MKFYTSVECLGDNVYCRWIEDGERKQSIEQYSPTLYVRNPGKQSKFKTIHGEPVQPMKFETIGTARDFIKKHEATTNFPVYGVQQFAYTYINEMFPRCDYKFNDVNVLYIDIETEATDGFPDANIAKMPITAITVIQRDKTVAIGCNNYEAPEGVDYIKCDNELDLLRKFINVWKALDPDIVTGWNVELFDIPYICNRIDRVLGTHAMRELSPFGIVSNRMIVRRSFNNDEDGGPIPKNIYGVCVLDYLSLYKKFTYTQQESYKLDHIAEVELGENKIDYSEYNSLDELYRENYQLFMDYNVKDTALVVRLEEKMRFIEQALSLAYDCGINYTDALTNVRMWDIMIHNELLEKNIVVPPINRAEAEQVTGRKIEGAYVKDPIVGLHNWVVSFDLNSLYPHLIMQYNISPETYEGFISGSMSVDEILNGAYADPQIRDHIEKNDLTVCGSGAMYTKLKHGFLPKIMQKVYNDRVQWKSKMIEAKKEYEKKPSKKLEYDIAKFNNMQMAKKIQLNSAYGALANAFFRWYDTKFAESITLSGQLSIRWMENAINRKLNKEFGTEADYVIAVDTDSLYITLDKVVETHCKETDTAKIIDFMDKVCEDILTPFIDNEYAKLARYVNAFEQKMFMKRENLADKGIWTGKKHYVLNVHDSEGVRYNEPKLKIMGLEAIKSSTPKVVRKAIHDCLHIMMNQGELPMREFIEDFYEKFKKMPFESIAFPRGCSNIDKYVSSSTIYTKGTPAHVKGAILFNHYVSKMKLKNKYELIRNGDKIKFCYLIEHNPIGEKVIGSLNYLPKEFNLENFIDYEEMFNKTFRDPIEAICDKIDWSIEHRSTLEEFFV